LISNRKAAGVILSSPATRKRGTIQKIIDGSGAYINTSPRSKPEIECIEDVESRPEVEKVSE